MSETIYEAMMSLEPSSRRQYVTSALRRSEEQMLAHWERCGRVTYRLPEDQLPYLSSIDLSQVTVAAIALPVAVVRFELPSGVCYLHSDGGTLHCWIEYNDYNIHLLNYGESPDQSVADWISEGMRNYHSTYAKVMGLEASETIECQGTATQLLTSLVCALFLHDVRPDYFTLDILAKDRQRYEEAKAKGDTATVATIEARAKRRKGNILNFHTGQSWLLDLGEVPSGVSNKAQGKYERTCSYIVRGHLRRVRYGKGRANARWHFFPPQIRRPDLAPKAIYKSDEALQLAL